MADQEQLQEWVDDLRSNDSQQIRQAKQKLIKLGDLDAVPLLVTGGHSAREQCYNKRK